jgi:hypothetical protein
MNRSAESPEFREKVPYFGSDTHFLEGGGDFRSPPFFYIPYRQRCFRNSKPGGPVFLGTQDRSKAEQDYKK